MPGLVLRLKALWAKITQWEFWPFSVLYFPVNFYYAWLALRYRSLFFFTAANPTIDFGGMRGESKADIYDLIPKAYLPHYQLIGQGDLNAARIFASQLGYPIVAKPDVGERGQLVERISNEAELDRYVKKCPVPFLVQELIDYPLELGVFYVKIPGEATGRVTSIVQKEFLHVIGDGTHTVHQLLASKPRALLQIDFNHPRFQSVFSEVPTRGEKVLVEGIGNHCRGTTFLNANDQITPALSLAFDRLSSGIEGFHFGRFDLRCKSFEDLERLQNFKILELNGAGAEPGHIYHPGYPLWRGYQAIFWHLRTLAQISRANHRNGTPYWTFRQGMRKIKMIKQHQRKIKRAL